MQLLATVLAVVAWRHPSGAGAFMRRSNEAKLVCAALAASLLVTLVARYFFAFAPSSHSRDKNIWLSATYNWLNAGMVLILHRTWFRVQTERDEQDKRGILLLPWTLTLNAVSPTWWAALAAEAGGGRRKAVVTGAALLLGLSFCFPAIAMKLSRDVVMSRTGDVARVKSETVLNFFIGSHEFFWVLVMQALPTPSQPSAHSHTHTHTHTHTH